ncbi:hypothetical protein KOR42_15720 [Thalassoglobus neptunius]|uniref:Methyltransferase domain-containing protein n=1 Tax=Thalassoglobus neptunius TaxID=1938619 RepID=A0A5C5X779_9PLAN|nr:class I SAM-dependent methyltransferase [Thalassoglobus neptunius]TWT58201.1 hypothetical protein KOR42_15720 [Thalassoglobus neptunius]
MTDVIEGSLYDYPKYYDLLFGFDWKAECDFLESCFDRYAKCQVKRLFEPACGTGRLMIKLAQRGYEVAGNDLNPHAVEYCNDRLVRFGFPASAVVEDMSDFSVKRKFHAAFNMINSFRHLETERKATDHFQCVANALVKGGLYILGVHLIPAAGNRMEQESWVARRGNLQVNSHMWCKELDLKGRNEKLGMTLDVYTPTSHRQIRDEMNYRTYTAKQMQKLFSRVPEIEVAAVHDFSYDVSETTELNETSEDIVYILRKR